MRFRGPVRRRLVATLAVGLLAVGCTAVPQEPAVTPTAVAAPPETQLERQTRLDFEAAEKSYRAFSREYMRLAHEGGSRAATSTMKQHAAGPYLSAMVDFSRQRRTASRKSVGELRIGYVRPGPYSPSALTLEVCEDGSRVKNLDKSGRVVSSGIVSKLTLQLRLIDKTWKVWNGDDEVVTTCGD